MTHSRNKGTRGERAAAAYLTSIGFPCKRMGRNGYSDADLKGLEECLPNVHVEVKFGVQGLDMHTSSLRAAWEQAAAQVMSMGVMADHEVATVLWKPTRRPWRLTYMGTHGLEHVTGDDCIAGKLRELNGR